MSKKIKVQKDVVLEARYDSRMAAAYIEGRLEMPIEEYEEKYKDVLYDFECADYSAAASDYRLRDCNLCFIAEVQAEVAYEGFGLYIYAEATLPSNGDILANAASIDEFDEMTGDEILSVFSGDSFFWESCVDECRELAEAAFKKVCKAAGVPLSEEDSLGNDKIQDILDEEDKDNE
jgi:hypothetical protein